MKKHRMMFYLFSLMMLSSVLFVNCGRPTKLADTNELSLSGSNQAVDFNLLYTKVFQPKCITCHANFSTHAGLMASGAVVAKKPEQSSLYLKTSSGQMPKGGTPLSANEVTAIYNWISEGAPAQVATGPGGTQPPPTDGGIGTPPGSGSPTQPGSGGSPTPVAGISPTFAWIQSNVFTPRCIICHRGANAPAGYDLSSYETVMLGGRVNAGNPQTSQLFLRINNNSMPPGGPALSAEVKQAIAKWIENGAKNDAPAPGSPGSGLPTSTPPPLPPLEPKFASIMANIIQPRCLGCHNSTEARDGVILDSYSNLMKQVSPSRPGSSKLYDVIEENEMPASGPALSFQEKETIRQWISAGALNN